MKTLTEFSPLVLRNAAAAREAAGGTSVPGPALAVPVPAVATEGSGSEAAQASGSEAADVSGSEAAQASGSEAAQASGSEAAEVSGSEAAEVSGSEAAEATQAPPAVEDPAIAAIATALGVQPDRAARLIEALDIIGDRLDEVRLVRVFQGEKGPHGAVSRGEFHYVIDRVAGGPRMRDDRRGGRGERRGDRDKPRGLGSLKAGGEKQERKEDERPGRGEMPRAGIGWQLTAAPRDFGGRGRGRGPARGRGPGRRRDGGERDAGGEPGGGPAGEHGDRRDRRDRRDSRGPRRGPREQQRGRDQRPS